MNIDNNSIIIRHQSAFEYVPDRLAIASRIVNGLLAGQHASYTESSEFRAPDEMNVDQLVNDAVIITDKLIARIKETQK